MRRSAPICKVIELSSQQRRLCEIAPLEGIAATVPLELYR